MTPLQQKMQELAREFDARHNWWEQVGARAEKAKTHHFAAFKNTCQELQSTEILSRGLHRAAALAEKIKVLPRDLAVAYKNLRLLDRDVADPLGTINPTSRLSAAYAARWHKYADMLQQGRYFHAETILKSMEGKPASRFLRRVFLRQKASDQQSLRDDIERARRYAAQFEETCARAYDLRSDIDADETTIAKGLYRILSDKSAQAALRDKRVKNAARAMPELAFMTKYADGCFKMTLEDVKNDLQKTRGTLDMAHIGQHFISMGKPLPDILQSLREQSVAARRRYDAADRFINSARVTQRLETRTSRLVDGWYGDLRKELKTSVHMTDENAQSLIDTARTKMRRWTNPAHAQRSLELMERADFDPAALPRMPWHSYTMNAGLDGLKRAAWELPIKAFSKTAQTIGGAAVIMAVAIRDLFSNSSGKGHAPRAMPGKQQATQQNTRLPSPPVPPAP